MTVRYTRQRYERGKVVYKLKVVGECEPDRTGTTVTFFPDAEIFDDTVFDYDTLKQRFREMAFFFLTKRSEDCIKRLERRRITRAYVPL